MSKSEQALALVDSGVPPSAAAKATGISRQAVEDAMKRRAAKLQPKPERRCSECGAALPASARAGAMTCSVKCRVARSRRLSVKSEAEPEEEIDLNQFARVIGTPGLPFIR